MSKLRDMKKRFLPLSMLLITMVLAQASIVANAAGIRGKYTPRTASKATFSSFMKSIRANQETGLIDPAYILAGQKAVQSTTKDGELGWAYAGPDNFGGFTKAVIYNNDGSVVIGTAAGDIYKTTNAGITFGKIASLSTQYYCPISTMAKDDNGDIFIGTGNSEIGTGYGVYKMAADGTISHLSATTPSPTNGWYIVNEMTYTNGKLYAATANGIMVSENNGDSWSNAQEGMFMSVKSNNNGDVLAADTVNVFLSKKGEAFQQITGTAGLPNNEYQKVIAMSPNDANYMYIAYYVFKTSNTPAVIAGDIYYTKDNGDTWEVALGETSMYSIFNIANAVKGYMAVSPTNPKKFFIGDNNIWVVEDATSTGVYRPQMISEYIASSHSSLYVHGGLQNIAFSPVNPNTFFIGTDGGIFKGTYAQGTYSYTGGNRYYLSDDEHTSVARMLSVGIGGVQEILGGCLDHGTIHMLGDESFNNVTTGDGVFPHITNNGYMSTYFTSSFAGGPCAISTINPAVYFVSGTGALSTPIYRTETSGDDYDGNFEGGGESPVITNENAFRTPYSFFETYDDNHTSYEVVELLDVYNKPLDTIYVHDTVYINDSIYIANGVIYEFETILPDNYVTVNDTMYQIIDTSLYTFNVLHNYLDTLDVNLDTLSLTIRKVAKANDQCFYYSKQGRYPISYTLPEPPHDAAHVDPNGGYRWIIGDVITGLHDPLRTNYVVAVEGAVYMTRNALIFDMPTDWFKISKISGLPTATAISADGTTAYVGTEEGHFYKFTHINDVFAAEHADVKDTLNICVEMTADSTTFAGRSITAIAVNPTNGNDIMVTLGNYGNNGYVYRSNNGGSSFNSIQGNLPEIPVLSGIIEKKDGSLMIGTEYGIYVSTNGTSWTKAGDITCPVMDIKQAIMANRPDVIDVLYDEAGDSTLVVYKGISNEYMIYAATYGAGILSCDAYYTPININEPEDGDEITVNETEQLNVYPNPVRDNAQVNIKLDDNASVSYVIYDLAGHVIAENNLGSYVKGTHTLNINTNELSSGTYIIRINAGDKAETGKFLVY